jgi:NAD(P)-dependent dehydrogenase (short-subunit alcohol dehydrogenase family)
MNLSSFSLEGKKAIVTGAASAKGIGRAIALKLAGAGADVAVCDVNLEGQDFNLADTAGEIRKLGRRSIAVKVDISNEKDVDSLVEKVVREFGTIDIMVNNAGVGAMLPSIEITRAQWDKMMDINVRGCHFCCLAASRVMKERKKGSIINISSISGTKYSPNQYVYGISKAGNRFITMWLAREFIPFNIRVNGIAPGMVQTDINAHDIAQQIHFDHTGKTDTPHTSNPTTGIPARVRPQDRICQPDDIANVALFFAADASAYISGQVIVVDGGVSL